MVHASMWAGERSARARHLLNRFGERPGLTLRFNPLRLQDDLFGLLPLSSHISDLGRGQIRPGWSIAAMGVLHKDVRNRLTRPFETPQFLVRTGNLQFGEDNCPATGGP